MIETSQFEQALLTLDKFTTAGGIDIEHARYDAYSAWKLGLQGPVRAMPGGGTYRTRHSFFYMAECDGGYSIGASVVHARTGTWFDTADAAFEAAVVELRARDAPKRLVPP